MQKSFHTFWRESYSLQFLDGNFFFRKKNCDFNCKFFLTGNQKCLRTFSIFVNSNTKLDNCAAGARSESVNSEETPESLFRRDLMWIWGLTFERDFWGFTSVWCVLGVENGFSSKPRSGPNLSVCPMSVRCLSDVWSFFCRPLFGHGRGLYPV